MQSRWAPLTRRPGSCYIPCTGALCLGLPCAPRRAEECPGSQEGSRVLMSITSSTKYCPNLAMSLYRCFPLLGDSREAQTGPMAKGIWGWRAVSWHQASRLQPVSDGKDLLVVSKNDANKKITCCRNTPKGRSAAAPCSLLFLTSLQTQSSCETAVVRRQAVLAPSLLQGCCTQG